MPQRDGYERSGRVMDDKLRGLYEQLGLLRDPAPCRPATRRTRGANNERRGAAPLLFARMGGDHTFLFWAFIDTSNGVNFEKIGKL